MADKLAEIKARMQAFRDAREAYQAFGDEIWDHNRNPSMEARLAQSSYWNIRDADEAWDALALLMPILEAAIQVVDGSEEDDYAEVQANLDDLDNLVNVVLFARLVE